MKYLIPIAVLYFFVNIYSRELDPTVYTPFMVSAKGGYSQLSGLGGFELKSSQLGLAAGTLLNPVNHLTYTFSLTYYRFKDGSTSFVSAAYTPNGMVEETCGSPDNFWVIDCEQTENFEVDLASLVLGYRWEWTQVNLQVGAGLKKSVQKESGSVPEPMVEVSLGIPLFYKHGPDLPKFR